MLMTTVKGITSSSDNIIYLRGKEDKAPGPDNMHPGVLKEVAEKISMVFTHIFNSSLETERVPGDWRVAINVTLLLKKISRKES